MRLAVISDIHGNLAALEAVLADIAHRGVDRTINLGDCCTSPLWPRETFETLEALALPTVRGNHDRWLATGARDTLSPAARFTFDALTETQRSRLGGLPAALDLGSGVLAIHGTPGNDAEYLTEEVHHGRLIPSSREAIATRLGAHAQHQVVLCGHSHRQFLLQLPGGALILNPGSVGCPLFADSPAAATLEPRSPHARYAILTRRGSRWAAEMLIVDYDWDAASEKAAANGFPAWAMSMATGSVVSSGTGAAG